MAATVRSSTPPPSRIRTPQTPRWGAKTDDYQPYSPRKSARLSQISHGTTTPPRQSSRNFIHSSTSSTTSPNMTSTPSSPQTAKKRSPRQSLPELGGRRVSGALTKDSAITAASALGLSPPKDTDKMVAQQSASTVRKNGMLPTPAKTPKKRPEQIAPAVTSIARNLFAIRPDSEVMPSPKKGRKRYTGFTLDSFEAEEESTPIQIYTDSHDRVPEVDTSAENPFYGESKAAQPEPTKRTSKRRKVTVAGEGEQEIDDLEEREDGLVYVFRGKQIFRKFTDVPGETDSQPESDTEEADVSLSPRLRRPLTRGTVKPRLLFPGPERAQAAEVQSHNTEDEEADTDIEDCNEISSPTALVHGVTATPKAPRFGPFTPPTTVRTTRSKKVDMSSSPLGPGSDDEMADNGPSSPTLRGSRFSRASPSEDWSRGRPATRDSKKRVAEAASRGAAKKVRM